MNAVRRWTQEHLRQGSEFVLSAAPTGAAAYLIGGSTLHSLLYLPVLKQNQKMPQLQGSNLKSLQDRFKNVALLVVDEKSMIGQKTFYMISERLKEARPQTQDLPFGGVSIILLGDWMQLPPVADAPIYSNANKTIGYNLYRHFEDSIIFAKVQRQEGDDQAEFRSQLEKLANGHFTVQDWEKWTARSLTRLPNAERERFETTATMACAFKRDMHKVKYKFVTKVNCLLVLTFLFQYNVARIKALGEPIAPIEAENDCSEAKGVNGDNNSGLPSNLLLCRGAKIRLTSNLWQSCGLVNGSVGFIHSIIYNKGEGPTTKCQMPRAIIATFEGYIGPSYLPDVPKAVPIIPGKV